MAMLVITRGISIYPIRISPGHSLGNSIDIPISINLSHWNISIDWNIPHIYISNINIHRYSISILEYIGIIMG